VAHETGSMGIWRTGPASGGALSGEGVAELKDPIGVASVQRGVLPVAPRRRVPYRTVNETTGSGTDMEEIMAFEGMDTSTVQTLINALNTAYNDVTGAAATVNSTIGSTNWVGPDRNHFDSEWNTYHGQLNTLASNLQGLMNYVHGKMQAQETAASA
jgi:hypothetical protein